MIQLPKWARHSAVDRWSNHLLSLLPLVGLGLVLALIGWPLDNSVSDAILFASRLVAGCFSFIVLLRWAFIEGPHWQSLRGYLFGPVLALLILGTVLFESGIGQFFAQRWQGHPIHFWLILTAAIQQGLVFIGRFREWMPYFERGFLSRLNPGLVLVITFSLLILSGALLLKMPNATTGGISFLDALFTSTSAVCVTGLIVVDTATAFTPLGQGIILLLIQLGAFGIVTLTFFLAIVSGQGFSVSSRLFLRDLLSVENMRHLSATIATIILLTFTIEGIGAALLYYAWQDGLTATDSGWWMAIFHSVSAFCNAGFSLFTQGLAAPQAVQQFDVQGILMALIILGGIGFPVLLECGRVIRKCGLPKSRKRHGPMFSVHTRLVCILTLFFLLAGMLLLWGGGGAMAAGSSGAGLWEALFNSVTARTAGFNISDMSLLPSSSVAIMILLMFIGGSPGGIAGGIKTTTFAVAMLNLRRILLNRRDMQMFERRIDDTITNRAFAVVLLSILWIFAATTALLYLQPEFPLLDSLFECVSAFSTVGLSRGITGDLTTGSKIVILLTMLVGRIGVLNFFFSLVSAKSETLSLRYPRERIIIE